MRNRHRLYKLWGGRFKKKGTDPLFERFSSSFKWDIRLLPYELRVDRAHVRALRGCGVLSAAESRRLLGAVADLERRHRRGNLKLDARSEDIHSAIHEAISRIVGSLADKLHTARSRNELVSQSTRLYCLEHALEIRRGIERLQKAFVRLAERHRDVLVADMTHGQRAQVALLAHIALAYVEMLERAKAAIDFARSFSEVCVLGSGALAGSTLRLDQERMARELGQMRLGRNSHDVAGDRDFVLALLFSIHFLGIQLSRIAEDLLVDKTRQHSAWEMDASFTTGSSMMPQKKNWDLVELTRGACAVFASNYEGLSIVLKGLATSYNRDLQWDKKFLFDSVEMAEQLLEVFTRMMSRAWAVKERVEEQFQTMDVETSWLFATDLADYLVRKGVPFARAHEQVGRIVSFSEEKGVAISRMGLDLLKRFAPKAEGDVYDLFDPQHSVRMKRTIGSTNPKEVRKQINLWKKKLGK